MLATRKIETSDPKELDEAYLMAELGLASSDIGADINGSRPGMFTEEAGEKKPFARPRGPARKR